MDNYKYIELKFDTAKLPVFKEVKGKAWVEYGEDNNYGQYLLSLYNESPKHGAIIKSKCGYIAGQGFEIPGIANSKGETWNNILRRLTKDDELFRGFYLQVIWNRLGQIADVFHIEFNKVRPSKDLTLFYVKNDWKDGREKAREYPAFNVSNKAGSQIFYFKEYNPTSDIYPVPSYIQSLAYIESDIQVSRHILGNAKQGFVGSKLINLNNGKPPSEEEKGEVEKQLLKKFTGSEGKRVVIMFNPSKDNAAEILDLGNTMLTKEDFTNINNLIQQEIFAGHQVVSPALMGIKTEGQLGSSSEIRYSYEIFRNTYVNERQQNLEEIITKFRNLKGKAGEFKIIPVEPLKFEFSEAIMAANLTQDEIREIMGFEPLIGGAVTSDGQSAITTTTTTTDQPLQASNEAIRNLTGRQYQNVMRIVRHFTSGKINQDQATLMLKQGFGFSDDDVNTFLGIEIPETLEFTEMESDALYNELIESGESFSDYTIIKSYPVRYQSFDDLPVLNQLQANILEMMTKDKRVTPEGIARAVNASVQEVEDTINFFVKNDIIKVNQITVGQDTIIEREVKIPPSELDGKKPKTTEIFIRYTYEGPIDGRNRPFCHRLVRLSGNSENPTGKTWSMADIQAMSFRLGYSVLDRRGGYWNDNGEIKVHCRHDWIVNVVTKNK